MTKRRTRSSKTSNTQRAVVSGISGAVIILIVLIAQFVFGIDVLPNEQENANNPPVIDTGGSGGSSGAIVQIPGGIDGGWFQAYFTQPSGTTNFSGAPVENALIRALDGAQQTIDAALYELNSQPITDALIRAHQRNVRVRIVTDGEFGLDAPDTTVDQLELAGIEVQSDGSRNAYMHDKFVVIDSQFVWTGSTNLTHEGIYKQNNNAILIRSSQLAQNFTTEFEELFAGQFGKSSPKTVPNPVVTVNETQIETIFESEGDAASRLAALFNQAQSVRFLAFSFTDSLEWTDQAGDHSVMDLLRDRAVSGQLDLKGIVDVTSRRFIAPLFCAGLDVRQDGNTFGFLHDKVMIIDQSIVVTGSFNFSASAADDNDENMLIIHNPDMAQAYLRGFDQQWAEAEQLPASEISCN
jgi:phosphatidylserine/phosphatidylglycerophosphate/cardiolipin synthase-like enzyme